jgi:DNA polymerase III subunit beta
MVETDHKFEGFSNETRVLIPKKAMTEVQRLVGKSGDDLQIEFGQDESHLFFQVGRRLLTSRKLTGQFPNYEAVLPRDANKTLSLERVELQDALRRVAQLADQRSHAVKFTLTTEGLEVSSSSPEYGEAKEIIEKEFKGETIAIGFNAQYLLDFLAAAADGPISFELKDEQSAGQLRPTGDETSRYRYVVMPMRI